MNWVDVCIVVYLVPFVILGYRVGFLKKSLGIGAFFIGFIVATKSMAKVGGMIYRNYHLPKEMSNVVAFFLVLALVIFLKYLLSLWIKSRGGGGSPELWSRIVGAVIGMVEGTIAASLMLILLFVINFPREKMRQESFLYRRCFNLAPAIFDYSTMWVPESKAFLEELKDEFEHPNVSK